MSLKWWYYYLVKKLKYGLYDFANSSFSAVIITFIFSAYFARQIVGDVQLGASYWQWTTGICGLIIAVTGPYLGIVADQRKNGLIYFLRIFTILCVLITCLFWFSKPETSFIFYTLIIFWTWSWDRFTCFLEIPNDFGSFRVRILYFVKTFNKNWKYEKKTIDISDLVTKKKDAKTFKVDKITS